MKKIILMAVAALLAVAVSTAAPKQEKQIVTTVFITDIDCEGCAKKVTNTIPYERGIKNLKIDVTTKSVTVTYDAAKNSVEQLTKAFANIKVTLPFGRALIRQSRLCLSRFSVSRQGDGAIWMFLNR